MGSMLTCKEITNSNRLYTVENKTCLIKKYMLIRFLKYLELHENFGEWLIIYSSRKKILQNYQAY